MLHPKGGIDNRKEKMSQDPVTLAVQMNIIAIVIGLINHLNALKMLYSGGVQHLQDLLTKFVVFA